MIDFVSTRIDTSEEARRNARFMAMIIARVVQTAATRPAIYEAERQYNALPAVVDALDYLFSVDSAFEEHISFIGGDAQAFREALLSDRDIEDTRFFNALGRSIIQARYSWWVTANAIEKAATT
jgi:hypothetical protein